MGGKPYQSKGCRTCKKRKIKCDEGKPACSLCIKRGLTCLGYEDPMVFRSSTAKRLLKKEKMKATQTPALPSPALTPSSSTHPASRVLSIPEPVRYGSSMYPKIIASFMDCSFPPKRPNAIVTLDHFLIQGIIDLPNKGDMVDKALSALACLFMGRRESNPQLLEHGVNLYNSAIRSLAAMLCRNPSHEDIIYTAYLFQEIEGCYCPHGLEKWNTHVMGLTASLRSCQDKHHRTENPLIQAIYTHKQKANIIFSTTGVGLTENELAYLMEPTNGNPFLELLQTLVEIGTMLTDFNTLDPSDTTACNNIISRCSKVESRLVKLCVGGYFGFQPTEHPSQEFNCPGIPHTETLFGTAYQFSSPDNACLHIMFWGQLTIIHSLIHQVSSLMTQASSGYPSPPGSPSNDPNLISDKYADMVARATPYCLQESMKATCMRVLIYVTNITSRYYMSTSNREKFDWTLNVYKRISECAEIATHVSELMVETWDRQEGTSLGGEICISLRQELEIFLNFSSC